MALSQGFGCGKMRYYHKISDFQTARLSMGLGTRPEDRPANTLPYFCRERPKTDRLAPDSFFWAGLARFQERKFNLVAIDQFFVFRDKNLQAAVRYACGGTCKFSWSRLKK